MFGLDFLGDVIDQTGNILGGGNPQKATGAYDQGISYLKDTNPEAGTSAYLGADPSSRAAQMDALSQLQNKYKQGGLDAIDRARVGDIYDTINQGAAAGRAGVMQDAQRRGLYNSGNALVSAQMAGQNAAQMGAQQARDTAGLAEQSRMGSIMGAGQLAGGIRGQDYQKAQAQDLMSQFNARQRLGRAEDVGNMYGGQAGQYNKNADRDYGMIKDITRGVGSAMSGGASSGATAFGQQ